MITEYRHIVAGLPVMYLIVVVAMIAFSEIKHDIR